MQLRHRLSLTSGALHLGLLARKGLAEDVSDVDGTTPDLAPAAGRAVRSIGVPPPSCCISTSISLSSSSPDAQLLAGSFRLRGRARGLRADKRVEHALLGGEMRLARCEAPCACPSFTMRDRRIDEVAHDLLDVTPDIANLGELGGLHLEEGGIGEFGEAARDLGLADSRSDRSSGCSWAAPPRASRLRAGGGASGCAARSPRRAWRPSARR